MISTEDKQATLPYSFFTVHVPLFQ